MDRGSDDDGHTTVRVEAAQADHEAHAASSEPSRPDDVTRPEPGGASKRTYQAPARIGRYVVLRTLGEGGMGVVLAAYDEQLDRRVAVKVLFDRAGAGSSVHHELVREAQALARLSHPNVVSVFEVGEDRGRVYMAMELVQGSSLGRAAKDAWAQRGSQGVLELYVQAARGLHAAHEAGLVHRDFKPSNAIVDLHGRVRVLDFGLARAFDPTAATVSEDGGDPTGGAPSGDLLASRVVPTVTGMVMGTPAYMSPEQHIGDPVDARTDQFSFCVALYEGLYGQRPYQAERLADLAAKVHAGVPDPVRDDRGVPPWLRKIVLRGLHPHPDDRWPSLRALLDAIEAGMRRRRPWRAAVGVGGLVLGLSYLGTEMGAEAETPCVSTRQQLDGAWGEASRERLRVSLTEASDPRAEATWSRVAEALDDYAEGWMASYEEACWAHQRREQSDELYDLRVVCLDERRDALEELVEVLGRGGPKAASHAIPMVLRLPAIGRCADIEALAAQVAPPEDEGERETVAALRRVLSRVRILEQSEHYDEGRELAEDVLARARRLGYAPLIAEALTWRGSLMEYSGDYEAAERAFSDAFWAALGSGHDESAVNAARLMIFVKSVRFGLHEEAAHWGRLAEALMTRSTVPPRVRSGYHTEMANLHHELGEYPEALRELEIALEINRQIHPGDHPDTAVTLSNIAHQLKSMGDYAEARRTYEQAAQMHERLLGPDSDAMADQYLSMAYLALDQQHYDEAQHWLEKTRAAFERRRGVAHKDMPYVHRGLAEVARGRGDLEGTEAHLQEALELCNRLYGGRHALVARLESDLADLDITAGRFVLAKERLRRAADAFGSNYAPGHVQHAYALLRIARIERMEGDRAASEAMYAEALEVAHLNEEPEMDLIGALGVRLAELAYAAGDIERATRLLHDAEISFAGAEPGRRDLLDEEVAVLSAALMIDAGRAAEAHARLVPLLAEGSTDDDYPEDGAQLRFVLARAKVALYGMNDDARALVAGAVELLERGHMPAQASRLRAWLGRSSRRERPRAGGLRDVRSVD